MTERFTRNDNFSYTCNRCTLCCYAYTVRVNPYEIARLANYLGKSTSEVIAQHTQSEGIELRREKNGACNFLQADGCSVHPDRPLACRLYPLGRHTNEKSEETFSQLTLQKGSKGEFSGEVRTVGEFLEGQGAEPYIRMADRYNALVSKIVANGALEGASEYEPEIVLDVDLALAKSGSSGLESGLDPEAKSLRHIEILKTRLGLDGAES
ncbi:MAG: YkgJ family cysteine cluster protein [Bdellovibrionales bacterium]|nr:YkgJ family cysteine cluster protein [Bdellovibrionales bacterium]